MIATDLYKQQALEAYPKTLQQINITGNIAGQESADTTMLFTIEEVKGNILDFSQRAVIVS